MRGRVGGRHSMPWQAWQAGMLEKCKEGKHGILWMEMEMKKKMREEGGSYQVPVGENRE